MNLAVFAISFLPTFACINTSYSRTDEVEITNDLGHLIIGAFAHHGKDFYASEVSRCLGILKKDPGNFEARNDLGAAYTKLGRWHDATLAFTENERRHPGKYKTASNLGVMYKKMEQFKEAERWIAKALEIKPGGHMGLGDYYLQMIQWRSRLRENETPQGNFLGVSYAGGPRATANVANREYVITPHQK